MNKKIEDWLHKCPTVVVARVMDDVMYLRHLAISSSLYQEGTLVVIPLDTLVEIFEETENETT